MSMDSSPTILSKEIFEKKYLKKMLILPFEKILQPLKNPLFAELFFQFEPTVAWGVWRLTNQMIALDVFSSYYKYTYLDA